MAPVEEELMGRTREEMEHAAVDALDATRAEGRAWFGLTANEVVKRVLDAALPDFREASIAEPNPARVLAESMEKIAADLDRGIRRFEQAGDAGERAVTELREFAISCTVPEAAEETDPTLLAAAARQWELIARDALEERNQARDALPREMPAPAERRAEEALRHVMDELRPLVDPHDLSEAAEDVLRGLGQAGLLTPGDVVVRDARALGVGVLVDGRPVEPERVHLTHPADTERRDLVPEALAVLAGALGDEEEAHLCTCGHSPDAGCVGCSEGFTDRCRFELAIRRVLDR